MDKTILRRPQIGIKKSKTVECHQKLTFGPSKQYISNLMVELPVLVWRLDGKEDILKVFIYPVDADVPFLCGKRELKDRWKSKIDTENNILEIKTDGKRKDFRMIGTGGNHVALEIEKRDLKDWRHNKNCYICEQCSNWYESREDLEDHRRRRHTKYNCDQCGKWYNRKENLEDHKKRRHTKECEEKLVCRNEREEQKKEEHRSRLVCNLCEEKFKNKSELKEHWETDHEGPVYECIHLEC